jgi:iron-sulfur cluster repair protein YtfE (RIC family)
MTRLTEPLRDEHRELRPRVDEILTVADLVGDPAHDLPIERITAVSAFLQQHLLRHAAAEEAALYPIVGWALGGPQATATMSRDHVEIARMSGELETLASDARAGRPDVPALRRVLYGLHAIIALHFAKEEEVYLPLLDERLTPETAGRLFAEMEEAARTSRAA